MTLRQFWREPLLHFLLLGFALFLLHALVAPAGSDRRIVVTQAQVDVLLAQYQKLWGRPPLAHELRDLVESHVRDEILYREGLALGLDRDDPVIKRRVRQKLEVMSEEEGTGTAPTDAELSGWLTRHADRFARPAILTFDQVYLGPGEPGADLEKRLAVVRAAAMRGGDPSTLGQATMLPSHAEAVSLSLVTRDFGAAFARSVETLPLDQWTGPVASGYGAHLVRVTARTTAVVPPLDSIRPLVLRDWEDSRRERTSRDNYERLRGEYQVEIQAALPGAGATP